MARKPTVKPKSKPDDKKPDGRPSKYQPDFAKQALKRCRLGSTDKELADFFEVSTNTIDNWKKAYPDFIGALKKGKDLADAEAANKLFKRATGYSHKAIKIFNSFGSIVTHEYIERYPPDTTACIFWLKNRQSAKWRDKQEPSRRRSGQCGECDDPECGGRTTMESQHGPVPAPDGNNGTASV